MSLTKQPAVPVHVLFKFCWDVALTVYVAGPWVFGTDVPYEALSIGYHLYVDGTPMLTITVYVLCGTGDRSATCVQSMAPTVRGNPSIL